MASILAAIRRWLGCGRCVAPPSAQDVGAADVRKDVPPTAAAVAVPVLEKPLKAAAASSANCIPPIFQAKYKTVVPDNFTTTNAVCLTSDVAILGNAGISGDTCVTGNVFIAGDLAIAGATCVTGTVIVMGNVHAEGDICVTGNAFVNGDCTVRGKLDVGGKFCVFGMKDIAPQQPSSVLSV